MKRRFSSQSLIVVLGALVVLGNFERAFGQLGALLPAPCTNLEPPTHQCAGLGGNANCIGYCTPVDCEAFLSGSTCNCGGTGTVPAATDCRNTGPLRSCGCRVDCRQLDTNAQCTQGSAATCSLRSEQCFVDCTLSNQICTSVPGFALRNSNTRCLITQGGTCTNPPTTAPSTTEAPPTTATTASTTTEAPPTTAAVTTTAASTTYANPGPSYPQPVPSVTNQRPYLPPAMMPYNWPYQPYPPFFNPYPPFVVQQSPLYEPERYGYRPNRHPNYPVPQPGPYPRYPQRVYRG